jgi:uncharacterized protein YeaO (DUF488 family)
MIFTGYYSKYNMYLEHGLTPIAISGKCPDWYSGLWWKQLAPTWNIFKEWKNGNINNDEYTIRFYNEVLNKLSVSDLYYNLNRIENPILLCYEKDGFCHRHLVSAWLEAHNIPCREYR